MTRKTSETGPYRIQVLGRAVDILQLFADEQAELGVVEVAERLALHKSTAHRLLMVLEQHRLTRRNPSSGKYALGLRLFELGASAVRGLRLREQAQRHLEQLVRETGETAHVCVFDRGDMVSIAYAEGPRTIRIPATVGRRTPAHCSAAGKATLAFLSPTALDQVLAHHPLRAHTDKTLVTREALVANLRQVRIRGYAVDDEEIEKGLRCVGAAVRNHSGQVIAGLSVAGPAFRITKDRIPAIARSVTAVASALSADLGFRVDDPATPRGVPVKLAPAPRAVPTVNRTRCVR